MRPSRKRNTKADDQKKEHQPDLMFDTTHGHGLCMLDGAGNIISWNAIAEGMLGYSAQEVIGKSYSSFFTKEDIRRKIFKKSLATAAKKGRVIVEGIRVRKNGSQFWARSFISLVKQGRRGVPFFVLITQDITHEKAIEDRREEYIGIASHELKNPIATLSLYSELLAKRLELDRDKKNLQMLRDIRGQAGRLVTLVGDLLTVGKLEGDSLELHKEAFNPKTFFGSMVRDFQQSTTSHKIMFSAGLARPVRADKERIAQVFINLLTNAIKYSPQGGKVHVRIQYQKNRCVVSVQDFGLGISKKDQQEIFARFFRTGEAVTRNISGLGLGLYIAKGIMKKHRERLWVESTQRKGSTFFFTLSLA